MRSFFKAMVFTGVLTSTLPFNSIGQKELIKEKIELREANAAMNAGDFVEARKIYLRYLNENPKNGEYAALVAQCFFELGEYEEALSYFKDISEGSIGKQISYHFYYGLTLKNLGFYQGALEQLTKFTQKARKKDLKFYEPDRYITQCKYALTAIEKPVTVNVEILSDSINTKFNDYHPFISLDGKELFFTSTREHSKDAPLSDLGGYYEKIYIAKWNNSNEEWGKSQLITGALNTNGHLSNSSLSADGNTMYLYQENPDVNSKLFSQLGNGDVYVSFRNGENNWSVPQAIENINTSAFKESGASVSSDGKKLFFISDRFGLIYGKGLGERDIWMSTLQEDGTWGKPENLGEEINSKGDESTVFIHPNGTTLFFTSNGHDDQNFGGYDIFKSELVKGKWTKAVNIGFPINTHRDEKEFIVGADGKVAWLTAQSREANRIDYDIFQVDLENYNVFTGESKQIAFVKGSVLDASTGLPLTVKIKLTQEGKIESALFKSDEDGNYHLTVLANEEYTLEIDHDNYKILSQSLKVIPPALEKKKAAKKTKGAVEEVKTITTFTLNQNIEIERIAPIQVVSKDLFKKQTIRFDKTDKGFVLNVFSKNILEMYANQLNASKDVKLSITGHFDNSVSYPQDEEEAKKLLDTVVEEIKKYGGDINRIVTENKGSNFPLGTNDTEDGKSINRRVEIKIVL